VAGGTVRTAWLGDVAPAWFALVTPSLLNDDLLRQLIAVGQVDLVVGVPTFNHAATIAATVRAAEDGLALGFPRERTVIISADGGSRDGTPDLMRELARDVARPAGGSLRTRHVISGAYSGIPARGSALRLIFAAADLLRARAVVVLDPEVTSTRPEWIGALAAPVVRQSFDIVTPMYDRHPLEAPLLSQLVRPVLRATLGRDVQEPLLGEFGCSGRFAAACLARDAPGTGFSRPGLELWLVTSGLAGGFTPGQAFLGPRTLAAPLSPRPSLSAIFPDYVGTLFSCLGEDAAWLRVTGSARVPVIGDVGVRTATAPPMSPTSIGESFGPDVRAMRSILESILTPDTLATLWGMIDSSGSNGLCFDDDLWVATVYDFAAAHHAGVMDRAHVAQALLPLYRGRLASFLTRHLAAEAPDIERELERLAVRFEQSKPYLIERWSRSTTR
jgi:hypothetical protein